MCSNLKNNSRGIVGLFSRATLSHAGNAWKDDSRIVFDQKAMMSASINV